LGFDGALLAVADAPFMLVRSWPHCHERRFAFYLRWFAVGGNA
jgi:hypothetical protein